MKWFRDEPGRDRALALRAAFGIRELEVFVPRLLAAETLNVAGRKWLLADRDLALAEELDAVPWRVEEPPLPRVAAWVSRGWTAYDATYVALAEAHGCTVVRSDAGMLAAAPALTTPLVP